MPASAELIDHLCRALGAVDHLRGTGDDPIYYLIYPVAEMLAVRQRVPAWKARLHSEGWEVEELSVADAILELLQDLPLRSMIVEEAARNACHPELVGRMQAMGQINKTIGEHLAGEHGLVRVFRDRLQTLSQRPRGLLLVTDLEALHPYARIGAIEQHLYGDVQNPLVVLYPGRREGKSSLRFLEFHAADGNYRSFHLGG